MRRPIVRRVVVAMVIGAALYLAHPLALEWMAKQVIVPAPEGPFDVLVILCSHQRQPGEGRIDLIASNYQSRPDLQILLFQEPLDRPTAMGITQPPSQLDKVALLERGVAQEHIQTISLTERDEWQWARRLNEWLTQNNDAQVAVLCPQFESRGTAYVLTQAITREHREQVEAYPLPDHRYDEGNWWKSRAGVKGFWFGGFNLLYARWVGEEVPLAPVWDPDAYEQEIAP